MEIDKERWRASHAAYAGSPQTAFARWVNHKAEYNSRTWEEYYEGKGAFEQAQWRLIGVDLTNRVLL